MDVDEDVSQFQEVVESQKRVLEKAKTLQGQRPCDRKPRAELYLQFIMTLMATKARGQRNNQFEIQMHSSFIPPAYLPCTTPYAQLTPTAIKDLRLETHHRGTYLLLRATTPPNRMTAIIVLVEDEHDDAILLQLYQQEEEDVRKATDIVDIGTILLIKEPFFKLMSSGDYGLRVDHLSDLVHVDKNDPILPKRWHKRIQEAEESAEVSKSKGDYAMGKGEYWKAIQEYTKAISQGAAPDRIEIIKRNRSLAYLRTEHFDGALSDVGFPNFGPKPAEKALFRAANSLYVLQRFTECEGVLETLCATYPDNHQASALLQRARRRCSEAKSGDYDFELLQREAKKLRPPHLDHATYTGPVEIRKTANKGRGLFVTEAVKAGDLLLCEKAFMHAYVPEVGIDNPHTTVLFNPERGRGFVGGQANLIKLVAQKLYRTPSVAPAFTALHRGSYETTSTLAVDGIPVVDTFLVERIMSLNVFGCPQISSLSEHKGLLANQNRAHTALHHSCGIWTQASYINHSCTSTARRSFIGDMMIVRATQDLAPGSEITFWYQLPDGYLKTMQKKLEPGWGFTCDCAICEHEKGTKPTVVAQRRKLLDELKRTSHQSAQHNINLTKMERLLTTVDNSYSCPADEVPRLLLWDPQLFLARIYLVQKKMVKALGALHKVFALLGFTVIGLDSTPTVFQVVKWGLVVDHLVEAFLVVRRAFEWNRAYGDAETAEAYAKTVYKIVVGEDTSFESTYIEQEC